MGEVVPFPRPAAVDSLSEIVPTYDEVAFYIAMLELGDSIAHAVAVIELSRKHGAALL